MKLRQCYVKKSSHWAFKRWINSTIHTDALHNSPKISHYEIYKISWCYEKSVRHGKLHSHRQLKNFLEELKDEALSNGINFFCIIRWLSSYNVLNRFVDLLDPVTAFSKEKHMSYSELADDECKLQRIQFSNTEFKIGEER